MWKELSVWLFLAILVFDNVCESSPASTHMHSGREREEDGGYSPRDHNHIVDGEHHVEFDHEAILGSVKEAEEFDQLPPEEAKKRLAVLLKKMDLDGDENISRKELKAWILRSFRMLSDEEAKERMEDADENEDGKVSWVEHVADSYGPDRSDEDDVDELGNTIMKLKDMDVEDEKLMKDDKVLFDAADLNKDGVLDASEYPYFSHPEEHPEMWPIILQQTLREKDTDNDGRISFQEFVGTEGSTRQKDREWLIAEKDKFDHDFDKDRDGSLDSSEIIAWMVPSNEEIAEEEVSHLFASSDDDHDDLLSFPEVLDHHDIFVGSEATDYGDHLHNIHTFPDEL
ncbi:reticulocalbin-2 isoform X1 [Ischnura elegans]|uniref:reticulocalbin-2 isoform X1 n=1 Tax=Ischnura elegans TaxID=197161 RepID=UPI001ED87892|nr:reticulocalbin-2 isoform X1 [Ischnura elegans]